MNELLKKSDISGEIAKYDLEACTHCPNQILGYWPFTAKNSYILGLGGIRETKINVKQCPTCKRGFYPQLFNYGLVPVHNKFLLRYTTIKNSMLN